MQEGPGGGQASPTGLPAVNPTAWSSHRAQLEVEPARAEQDEPKAQGALWGRAVVQEEQNYS